MSFAVHAPCCLASGTSLYISRVSTLSLSFCPKLTHSHACSNRPRLLFRSLSCVGERPEAVGRLQGQLQSAGEILNIVTVLNSFRTVLYCAVL